jgi:hypothetical protein
MDGGQALPLALIALAAGFLLVTVFALALGVYVKISAASATDLLDYYAADAGVERALAPLVTDPAAYPSPTVLSLTLNRRSVTVNITPGASEVIPPSGNAMTATVTTYVVTSAVTAVTIKASAEARHSEGQSGASVRITAWKVGQ